MAEIIAGVAMSHSPMIMTSEEAAGEKGQRFIATTKEMKKWFEESEADVIVLVSDDHFNSYFYDHMPSFTIGIGECEGWGDWEITTISNPCSTGISQTYFRYRFRKRYRLCFYHENESGSWSYTGDLLFKP